METTIKCHICKTTNSEHLINIRENMYECKACDSIFFHIDDLEIQHQLYSARDYSSTYDFDKADEIYNKVLNETDSIKTKVMCYHGKLLAEFEVNYIKGYKKDSNRMVVTFSNYDKNKTSIKESYYYKALMNLPLTADEKEKYETSIDELDASYHKIPEELQKTPEYDVFICVKISPKVNDDDNTSNLTNTKDSCIAEQIYNNLTSRGVKVFYSDVVRGYIGDDSEIISALLKSRMMLIICGATEFIESRWVQSEWRRWVNLINQGERDKNSLILLSTQEFTKPKLLKNIIEYELHEQLKLLDLLEERSKGSKKDSLTKEQKNPPMQNMDDSKNQDHLESMATKKESPIEDFEIKNGVLKKYKGRDNEVIIPEGVTSIGKNAFTPIDDFSANLISIVIPSSVRSIEIYAFVGCDRLVEVYNLSSLTITLGSSNNGLIGRYAKVIHTSLNEPSQLIKKDDYVFIKGNDNKYYLVEYQGNKTNLILPSNINGESYEINDYAFMNCENLKSITISEGVTSIGNFAFSGCRSLTYVKIIEGEINVEEKSFFNCDSLTSVIIPRYFSNDLLIIILMRYFFNQSNIRFYYEGTEDEWLELVAKSNYSIVDFDWCCLSYFYSEKKPYWNGEKYWHYIDGVPTKWNNLQTEQEKESTTDFKLENSASQKHKGKVKWYNAEKGYGFIVSEEGKEVFVHFSSICAAGFQTLNQGEEVTFEVVEHKKGLLAKEVHRA